MAGDGSAGTGEDDSGSPTAATPERIDEHQTEVRVVQTAADAAEAVVFDAYRKSAVRDLDVTVRFEAGELEVDVYLDAPEEAARVADEAARAARSAVDDLLE